MKEIAEEEKKYTDQPNFYTFPSKEAKEHILYENFVQFNREVDQMCIDIPIREEVKGPINEEFNEYKSTKI